VAICFPNYALNFEEFETIAENWNHFTVEKCNKKAEN
jgi:hypothetical protein